MTKPGNASDPQSPAMSLHHFELLGKILMLKRLWGAWVYVPPTSFNSWALKAQIHNEGGKNSKLTQKKIAAHWNVISEIYFKIIKYVALLQHIFTR